MKKFIIILILILSIIVQTGISSAQTFEVFLNAGASTVRAGLDANHTLDEGFLVTGLSGFYTNYDRGEYRSLEAHAAIKDDILIEGLSGKLGIKGLIGSADKGFGNSDLGSLAFIAGGVYRLPRNIFPVTTEVFTEITWTPHPLAFIDMDRYFDFMAGADVFLVQRAALEFAYIHYNMKFEADPREWTNKDDIVMIGIKMKF
ncbi:MAG: hypothetical protein JW944_08910 [Deltaproteobacteria bacterium]|nr:hypothetical protein [Deltaproteobacteria bacterium]